jgi:hypothetical protein
MAPTRRLLASIGAALLIAASPASEPLLAQRRVTPFGTIDLSVSGVANVNRSGFHELWHPHAGGELAVGTPIYLGWVELGAERMSFDGQLDAPAYRAWFLSLGWGLRLSLLRTLRWEPGLRIGSYSMRFTGPGIAEDRRTESELGTEAVSRFAWGFAPAWHLLVTGRYRVVLTEPEIRHAYLALGVRRTFGAPRWLRDFLN